MADLVLSAWEPPVTARISTAPLPGGEHRIRVTASADGGAFLDFTASADVLAGHLSGFRLEPDGSDDGPHHFLGKVDARRYSTIPDPARRPSMNAELAALTTPSALSGHDLFYVHLDERQCSATLGFTGQEGHDGFEFFLAFTDVRNVSVRGWGPPGRKDVRLERTENGITVSVATQGSSLNFEAADMTTPRTRSFQTAPGSS